MALIGVKADWPFHGVMRILHTDNGADFHSKTLERACSLLGIEQHFRKPGAPQHGAHIERLLGTFAQEIHTLPGTTFRSPQARGDYDSAAMATYTIPELETYIAIYIAKIYHHARHSEIGLPPYSMYLQAEPWRSPVPLPDERTMRISLLPFKRIKTVQEYGIQLFNQRFYAHVLRRWIGVRPPDGFVVCHDPRDLNQVYFHDPELGQYFDIPRRNLRQAAPSLKIVQGTARKIRPKGSRIDPGRLSEALNELDALTAQSQAKTRRARRARASTHKPADTVIPAARAPLPKSRPVIDLVPADDEGPLAPFPTELWIPRS
ncbi:Mu transposase C-terminal domain-containing protein [Indioceanicola profundi]|uniref:Mu transposase C-terminal domain-containing protein n=1 Tax=Indioceanicola profundi TaxID=2220096 RepID=UPI0013C43702|nr:Mu transposase C-terminal domain-containing protein [Indioceanicola profundi]